MKIILSDPPDVIPRTPNLGILYLISALRDNFKDIEILYLETFLSLNEQLSRIETFRPDIYGISFASFLAPQSYHTINVIKEKFQNLPVICGGPHPSADPEGVLTKTRADICVIGEGEQTIVELIRYFKGERELENITGIAYKENGEIRKTSHRAFIRNLDSIKFPSWDIINIKNYIGTTLQKSQPYMMVIISRGCPYYCTYCANPVWKVNKPWYRARSAKNIVEEIELLYHNMGIREIALRCDEFNINLDWSIQVCREIKKLNHPDLYFQTVLRADKVTKELAQGFKSINCWLVSIGIESGNQRTLDGYGKKINLEQTINACKILKKGGIKVLGFFMIYNVWEENGNLCYESHQEVNKTLEFAKWLLSEKLLDFNAWGFVIPIIGSELYNTCLKYNLISTEQLINSKWKSAPIKIPELDERVMQSLKRKGNYLQIKYGILNGLKYFNLRDYKYMFKRMGYFFKN